MERISRYIIDPSDLSLKENSEWWGVSGTTYDFSMWSRVVEYDIAEKLTARGIEKDLDSISLVIELKGEDTLIFAAVRDSLYVWEEVCRNPVGSINFLIKDCEDIADVTSTISTLFANQIGSVLSKDIIRLDLTGGMIDGYSSGDMCKGILKEFVDFGLGGDIRITPEYGGYNVGVGGKGLLIPIEDINESLKLAGITRPNEAPTHIAGYIYNRLWRHRIV